MKPKHDRGQWLYERDGDLNPTWPLVVLYSLIGAGGVIAAFLTADPRAIIAAFGFLGAMITALLISALPRDKAKILAKSRAPGDVAKGITAAAAGMQLDIEDGRDEDQHARAEGYTRGQ